MAARIVIACVHDRTEPHPLPDAVPTYSLGSAGMAYNKSDFCDGGRVLAEGELVDLIDTHTQAIVDGLGIKNLVVAPGMSVALDLGILDLDEMAGGG